MVYHVAALVPCCMLLLVLGVCCPTGAAEVGVSCSSNAYLESMACAADVRTQHRLICTALSCHIDVVSHLYVYAPAGHAQLYS
jgi:hypothetical protein